MAHAGRTMAYAWRGANGPLNGLQTPLTRAMLIGLGALVVAGCTDVLGLTGPFPGRAVEDRSLQTADAGGPRLNTSAPAPQGGEGQDAAAVHGQDGGRADAMGIEPSTEDGAARLEPLPTPVKDGEACQPSCHERECGDDGCGQVCGSCPRDTTCSAEGRCHHDSSSEAADEEPASDAQVAVCGNHVEESDEVCDDGNQDDGDGCDSNCSLETGWKCDQSEPGCSPVCGDGLRVGEELKVGACDDDNDDSGDGCTADCRVEEGFSCSDAPSICQAGCGDGVVRGSEVCDDGNVKAGDGCHACALELGVECASALTSTRLCGEDGNVYQADLCGNPGERVAECPGDCSDGTCRCVIRVRNGGNDSLSGSTWATAKQTIQAALDAAASARCEVWLQNGTYRPWVGDLDRTASFVLHEGVSLYGGFAGVETLRGQRDWTTNVAYLSGGEDPYNEGVFHIVRGANSAHIDGVVVEGGNANDDPEVECGGGLLVVEVDQSISNVTFRQNSGVAVCSLGANLTINNSAFEANTGVSLRENYGGALKAEGGTVSVVDSSFFNNGTSLTRGGAIAMLTGQLTVDSSYFEGNTPNGGGGAIYCGDSELTVRRSQFVDNHCCSSQDELGGGAIYANLGTVTVSQCDFQGGYGRDSGGGIAVSAVDSVLVHNSRFINNVASGLSVTGQGGAVYASGAKRVEVAGSLFYGNLARGWYALGGALNVTADVVQLTNNTFVNNGIDGSEPGYGGAISIQASVQGDISNCLFWNNAAESAADVYVQAESPVTLRTSTFSNDAACLPASECPAADPVFLDVTGMDFTPTSHACIDQGTLAGLPRDVTDVDQDGDVDEPLPRDILGNHRLQGASVDLGAIEVQ